MAKQIEVKDNPDSEDANLIAKVDLMMEPRRTEADHDPKLTDEPYPAARPSDGLPPLDIFAGTSSAPLLKTKAGKKPARNQPTPDPSDLQDPGEQAKEPAVDADNDGLQHDQPIPNNPQEPDDFDDPKIAKAIESIVAQESDVALEAEDLKLAMQAQTSQPLKDQPSGRHPFFWFLVAVICLIAIGAAVYLADPSVRQPLSKIHWASLKHSISQRV